MGAGASSGIAAAVEASSVEEIKTAVSTMTAVDKAKLSWALSRPAFNFDIGFKVADDKTVDVDKFFADHMAFMKATHAGPVEPKAISYMVTKTAEPKDPNDPAAGTTGNTIYFMSESYGSMEACQAHFAKAAETGDILPRFQKTVKDFAVAVSMMVRVAAEPTLCFCLSMPLTMPLIDVFRLFAAPGPNRPHDCEPARPAHHCQAWVQSHQYPL